MIQKALHPRELEKDCMHQEKEDGDLPAFTTASIQRLEDHIKRRKAGYSDQKEYRQHKHQQNKNYQNTKMGRKISVLIFQETIKQNPTRENSWQRKGNLKKETESLIITAQNNAIRTIP